MALAYRGARVAAIDLDPRQRTLSRVISRIAPKRLRARKIDLPTAKVRMSMKGMSRGWRHLPLKSAKGCDFLVFDTPGRDDPLARHAATEADTLVTPMNDSFVDFDLIGQVEGETFKVKRLSASMPN